MDPEKDAPGGLDDLARFGVEFVGPRKSGLVTSTRGGASHEATAELPAEAARDPAAQRANGTNSGSAMGEASQGPTEER